MNGKKIFAIVIVGIMMLAMSAVIMPVSAIEPPAPANEYIQDVLVGNSGNPLDYDSGGVRILLTNDGDSIGMWWDGAWALSYWTIDSWESQTGESWPYQWRSRETVAIEILAHCWWFDTTQRYTTISFNDQSWD